MSGLCCCFILCWSADIRQKLYKIGDSEVTTYGDILFIVPQKSDAAEYCKKNNFQYTYPDANDWLNTDYDEGKEIRKTTADMNIREQNNTDAEIKGLVPSGSQVTVLTDTIDRWSKIIYEDVEGYVRTEYLS